MRQDRDEEVAAENRRREQRKADEQRDADLSEWVNKVWAHFAGHGTAMQRLRKAVTLADMVDRRGANLRRDEELMLQQLLAAWGPGKLVQTLGWLADQEARRGPAQRE
jgi:hypothetical protein